MWHDAELRLKTATLVAGKEPAIPKPGSEKGQGFGGDMAEWGRDVQWGTQYREFLGSVISTVWWVETLHCFSLWNKAHHWRIGPRDQWGTGPQIRKQAKPGKDHSLGN